MPVSTAQLDPLWAKTLEGIHSQNILAAHENQGGLSTTPSTVYDAKSKATAELAVIAFQNRRKVLRGALEETKTRMAAGEEMELTGAIAFLLTVELFYHLIYP